MANSNGYGVFESNVLTDDTTDLVISSATTFSLAAANTNIDPAFLSWDAGSPSRINIDTTGDYMVMAQLRMLRADANESRTITQLQLLLSTGAKLATDYSYIRNKSGHNAGSCMLLWFGNLLDSQYIEFTARNANTTDAGDTINLGATNPLHIMIRHIDSSQQVFAGSFDNLVGGGTDFALSSAVSVDIEAEARKDSQYTHSTSTNPEDVTIASTGTYFVFHAHGVKNTTASSVNHTAPRSRIMLDTTAQASARGRSAYIRSSTTTASRENSGWGNNTGVGIMDVIANEVFNLEYINADTGVDENVKTILHNDGQVYIQELPSTGVFCAHGDTLTSGTEWNPTAAANVYIEFDTEVVKDANMYTHSTVSNPEIVTVKEDGDYLLFFQGLVEINDIAAASIRQAPRAQIEINGTDLLAGALSNKGYLRVNGSSEPSHNQSSLLFGFVLEGLTAGDDLKIQLTDENGQVGDGTCTSTADGSHIILWRLGPCMIAGAQKRLLLGVGI